MTAEARGGREVAASPAVAGPADDEQRSRVGALVRDARARAGVTQGQLAERIGTAQGNVSAIELGARLPSLDMLDRIAQALGLELRLELRKPTRGSGNRR